MLPHTPRTFVDQVLYSCVVDAVPALYHQTMVWAWTAIDLAGIDPGQLVVHLIDGCDDRLRRDLDRIDVRCIPVRRFPKGTPMCNKLMQIESQTLAAHPRVVLADCDIAWMAPVDAHLFGKQPRAKVVDFANPPVELLEPLFREAGFPHPARAVVSIGGEPTFHNNCNGGLYLLSGDWLRRLREPWPRWLDWVEARTAQLGPYGVHMFQIAFALAMEELGAEVEHLPLEYNFPTNTDRTAGCPVEGEIRALHFHRAYDEAGLLTPTGVARVDKASAVVNACLRRRLADPWWLDREELVTKASVHGVFRAPRRDHVTRQFDAYGGHTRNELAMVLAFLRPGDHVIDVGAHIGTFTVPFARAVGPEGRVIAIEPGVDAFDLLLENLARNGVAQRVRAECALVTDRPGAYRPIETADHTSATYYLSAEQASALACLQLDSLGADLGPERPLRLIKIDVEGMELSVLRSADALIAAHRPLLYVEVVPAQLQRGGVTVADLEAFLADRRYAFFRNIGPRNSTNDRYEISRLATLVEGGAFFDCLAIPLERVNGEPALAGVTGVPVQDAAPWPGVTPPGTVSTAICVLGMHRTGTSLVTRGLNLLGVVLGPEENRMRPAPDNPAGFWEHQLLTDLNVEILEALGGTWHAPPSFPEGWETAAVFQDLRTRARRLIARDFRDAPIWAWKDPRACLTLPFWQQVVGPMRYVVCVRNPIDVARSLAQRDGFSQEKAVDLWVRYMTEALRHSEGWPRLFVSFDDIVDQPEFEFARIAVFTGDQAAPAVASIAAATASCDRTLRHHHAGVASMAGDPAVSLVAKSLYVSLRLLVRLQRSQLTGDDEDLASAVVLLGEQATRLKESQVEHAQLRRTLEAQTVELLDARQTGQRLGSQLAAGAACLQTIEAERNRAFARLSTHETPEGVAKLALRAFLPARAHASLRRLVLTSWEKVRAGVRGQPSS